MNHEPNVSMELIDLLSFQAEFFIYNHVASKSKWKFIGYRGRTQDSTYILILLWVNALDFSNIWEQGNDCYSGVAGG